jgi:predicted phosphodiesterase
MRTAFIADVHSRREKLEAALADAQVRGADRIVSLGDVGDDDCVALLRRAGALAVFGNYEVSGWQRLSAENREWVQSWPPLLAGESFLAVHAAPWWPEGLATLEEFSAWQQRSRQSWRALFPYLNEDDDYIWQALAELETAGKALLFHGHTHLQVAWRCSPDGRLRRIHARAFDLQPDWRYLVGAGSVGLPQDGTGSAYALYDDAASRVELIAIP